MARGKAWTDGSKRATMRIRGFEDGLKGKDQRHPEDPEYRVSYRRGKERAQELQERQ